MLTPIPAPYEGGYYAAHGAFPDFIKIDVEGSEVAALRGARGLLARPDRPPILLEFNPPTLAECGASVERLLDLLTGYELHYVDDLRGQVLPFGSPVQAEKIDWICNLFAVPKTSACLGRWRTLVDDRRASDGQASGR